MVEEAVQQGCDPTIHESTSESASNSASRLEDNIMLSPSYLRAWNQFVDRAICQYVSPRLHTVHAQRIEQFSSAARREFAQHITAGRIHVGFVEGDPKPAEVANGPCHLAREALKELGRVRLKKCPSRIEPAWVSEVMQTNNWLNASFVQSFEHVAIAL